MDESAKSMSRLESLLSERAVSGEAQSQRKWKPLGDLRQTKFAYTLFIDLPGIDEDEVRISYTGGILTVAGERDFDHDKEDAEEFVRIDRPYGVFSYEIALAEPVNYDSMSAKYKRGVLKIVVPRGPADHGRSIEVK